MHANKVVWMERGIQRKSTVWREIGGVAPLGPGLGLLNGLALTCVQDLGVCPGAVWNDKNLGGIVSTEEDQIITWKEFRWLCWLELIDIKWHLIVLSAKSSKVVSMRPVTRISSVRSLSAVHNRRERCGCSGCSEDTWEWALRYSWEGDHWNPWIPKENNMRNSGKCDNDHCTNCHTGCQYKSSTLLLEWFTDVLHSSGHVNYSSRRARDVVTQTDHLLYKVRLKSIICLALARWASEGTGYIAVFYT